MPGSSPFFLSFLFLHALLVSSFPSQDDTVLVTSSGPIKGKQLSASSGTVTAFLGIPYAEPPLGKLRFQKPIPHPPWSHVWEATSFGNSCPQRKVSNIETPDAAVWVTNTPCAEDCLFLNIWVPHPRPSTPAPVLVWIHGGGFITGTASLDIYNGASLAATENVIVASMNYRLGVLGFLYLPPAAPGNVGLWDQHLALKWVKENAAVFGGDPAQLTLIGHSAGAASVGFHLLSPASQPLFARAVLQSGAPNAPWAWKSPEKAKQAALEFSHLIVCATQNHSAVVSCLQGKDFEETAFYRLGFLFYPTTDGDFLLDEPRKLIEMGRIQGKPVLTGVTADEGSAVVFYMFPHTIANDGILTWELLLLGMLNNMAAVPEYTVKALAQKYSEGSRGPARYRWAMAQFSRDYEFVCPMADITAKMVGAGTPVYVYSFTHHTTGSVWPKWAGAAHGAEVPYLFGTLASVLGTNQSYTEAEAALSRRVMRYWAEFARSGKPTGSMPREVHWPLYNATEQNFFHISTEMPQVMQMSPTRHCDFLAMHFLNATHKGKSQDDSVSLEKEEDGRMRPERSTGDSYYTCGISVVGGAGEEQPLRVLKRKESTVKKGNEGGILSSLSAGS